MARLATRDQTLWLKAGVMGPSGAGKSSFGATAPRPIILMSERQGRASALERSRALGREEPVIVEMDTIDDYRTFARSFASGDRSQPFRWLDADGHEVVCLEHWPETIVLDSLTDACELVERSIVQQSPLRRGDDGLEVFSQRHWGELKKRCQGLIRLYRDLDAHVLFNCLDLERTTETTDGVTTRSVEPALPMRKLPDILMQATNVFGWMQRRQVRGDDGRPVRDEAGNIVVEVKVVTNGPSWIKVKPVAGLNDVEVPDFASWVARWRAHVSGGEQ